LRRTLFNTSFITLVLAVLITIIVYFFGEIWFGEYFKYLIYLLPLVFFVPLTALYDGIYRGLKRFKELAIISLITGGIAIGLVFFLVNQFGLVGALLSQNVMYLIYFSILAIRYGKFSLKFDKKIMKEIGSYSIAFGIATLGFYLFSRINVLILGKYNLLEEIATYELLNRIFTIYLLPFNILGQVLAPYVTELFALKKFKDVKKNYFKLVKVLFGLSVLFIPVAMLVTTLIVKWFFPQYDTEMFTALLLPIVLTYCKSVFSAPLNAGFIVATGEAGIMTVMNIFVGAINIAGSLWAIEKYGYIGVIWVTVIVQYVSLILLHIIYWKRLKKYGEK
jgi:O-antigen/teichoic acid export membrane protein